MSRTATGVAAAGQDDAFRPANLHVSAAGRFSNGPRLSERVEQKFFILPHRQSTAFALLRRTCRADREYPVGQVNSLYFDTPDLDQHQRSDSGEFVKDKVRIRWYGEEYDPNHNWERALVDVLPSPGPSCADLEDPPVRVWLELKSRRGFASTKQRVAFDVLATALAFAVLSRGIIPSLALTRNLAAFGFFNEAPLRPVIAISYWRHRFVEPQTGFRISIDSHIRSSVVMPGIGRGERGLELPGAVVEVKGSRFEVPAALHRIAELGSSWTRYSKYSSSLDGHESALGGVSRLWPSGVSDAGPGFLARVDGRPARERPGAPRFWKDYLAE